jgi:RHS repeat-associated protein
MKKLIATYGIFLLMGSFLNIVHAADQVPGVAAKPESYFYTGKPYDEDSSGYLFMCRTYNPETSRWTSADPSGFPDGPNNQFYAPSPTNQIDSLGLAITISNPTGGSCSGKYFGTNYTVTTTDITVKPVSQQNIKTLNNLYQQTFVKSASTPDFTVTVNTYSAYLTTDETTIDGCDVPGGEGGDDIRLTVPSGYVFTQDITTNDPDANHPANQPYPDLHNPGSAVSTNPAGTDGSIGNGQWYDVSAQPLMAAPVTWTANLYIEQENGSVYTVVGRLQYGFTIE